MPNSRNILFLQIFLKYIIELSVGNTLLGFR